MLADFYLEASWAVLAITVGIGLMAVGADVDPVSALTVETTVDDTDTVADVGLTSVTRLSVTFDEGKAGMDSAAFGLTARTGSANSGVAAVAVGKIGATAVEMMGTLWVTADVTIPLTWFAMGAGGDKGVVAGESKLTCATRSIPLLSLAV